MCFGIIRGADPLVRAGRHRPAVSAFQKARGKPTRGSAADQGADQGVRPISVNLMIGISMPFSARLSQLHGNLVPVSEGLSQTVGRQDRHTDLVKHEFYLPPSATPHCPIGIPRGKTCRPLPPCVRLIGWQRFYRAAKRAHLPDPFSAGDPTP